MKEAAIRRHVGKDGRRHVTGIGIVRHAALPGERCLLFAEFDHARDPLLRLTVDDRSDDIARDLRRTDSHGGSGGNERCLPTGADER